MKAQREAVLDLLYSLVLQEQMDVLDLHCREIGDQDDNSPAADRVRPGPVRVVISAVSPEASLVLFKHLADMVRDKEIDIVMEPAR